MVSSSYTFIGSNNPKTILGMAAMIAGLALLGKSWISSLPEPVSTEFAKATVLSLEKKSMKSTGKLGNTSTTHYMFAELELEDGNTFHTLVPRPYPNVGQSVPVKVTKYDDGTAQAAVISEL